MVQKKGSFCWIKVCCFLLFNSSPYPTYDRNTNEVVAKIGDIKRHIALRRFTLD